MILPGYANGFAPRDGQPLYPSLWRGCVGAWAPCLGPTGVTLRDWSAFKNNGTLTNMDPGTDLVTGQKGYELDFDGSNDQIAFANSDPLNITNAVLSISCHLTVLSGGGGTEYFISKANSLSNLQYAFGLNSGLARFFVGGFELSGSHTIVNGQPVHFAMTCNGASMAIYRNGILLASTSSRSGTQTSTSSLVIGQLGFFSTFFRGRCADVMVWNRQLNAKEVAVVARRPGIAYELAPRRRSSVQVAAFNRRRRLLVGAGS